MHRVEKADSISLLLVCRDLLGVLRVGWILLRHGYMALRWHWMEYHMIWHYQLEGFQTLNLQKTHAASCPVQSSWVPSSGAEQKAGVLRQASLLLLEPFPRSMLGLLKIPGLNHHLTAKDFSTKVGVHIQLLTLWQKLMATQGHIQGAIQTEHQRA